MLNVVVVCGGTGSIPLQQGFASLYGIKNYNMDIIINAYDNGKSTGACRRVFNHSILGPSDLRKNQLTRFQITYTKQLEHKESYESKLFELFELRFSAKNYLDYYLKSCEYINNAVYLNDYIKSKLLFWINYFFYENVEKKQIRKTVSQINFTDFSLSNIFYASSAALNKGSLSMAGSEIAKILGIEDKVHLVSDINLYLKAETEGGKRIEDEADIVEWDNPEDKIIRVLLLDEKGNEYKPSIDEQNSHCVKNILEKADLIIFSSGTQWSSLIPTYMHGGFREVINHAKAKKYLIMNNVEDHDMYGVSADNMLDIIGTYLDLHDITVVVNDNSAESMRKVSRKLSIIHGKLSEIGSKKHIPQEIAKVIMKDYFGLVQKYTLISDLDGTLWNESGSIEEKKIGKKNLSNFEGIILSGNTYEHVLKITKEHFINRQGWNVFCDYGNTYFSPKNPEKKYLLSKSFLIDDHLKDLFEEYSEFKGKVQQRGGTILTIKPLENRKEKLCLINRILSTHGNLYEGRIAGRTSIDVVRKDFSKEATLSLIMGKYKIKPQTVFYIGNELDEGNEVCIKNLGIKTLQVNDVFEMYIFLMTYNSIF